MDSNAGQNVGAIGQPLANLFKRIEANRIASEQQTPIRPPRPSRSERGSSSAAEGISASDCTVEYLVELMKEKCQLGIFPQLFPNVERLIDEEVGRVRSVLFHCSFSIEKVALPEPEGVPITVQEKVYVPFKEHPDYNFVGRILGPRGMTAKQLEQETGCRIMIRGRGSMRDRRKETNRGKPNWEHLEEELHVVVQCEDTPNRVHLKLKTGVEQIMKLLVPTQEGADDLKRKQLMELAILNGTYRPAKQHKQNSQLMSPMTLMSPIGQTPSSMQTHPVFVSPVGSPITPASNNSSLLNSILHTPNVDYSMLMNQLTLDAALSSLSSQSNGDCQTHTSPFNESSSLSTSPLFNPLQSYLIDPTTFTPPASANSDRH